MTDSKVSFLGSVLKAVVSTPNEGQDATIYQRDVLEVARDWRRKLEDEVSLGVEEKVQVLRGLLRVFEVKRVAQGEVDDRLREILSLHDPDGSLGRKLKEENRR